MNQQPALPIGRSVTNAQTLETEADQLKTAALKFSMFWLCFRTMGGSGDMSSILTRVSRGNSTECDTQAVTEVTAWLFSPENNCQPVQTHCEMLWSVFNRHGSHNCVIYRITDCTVRNLWLQSRVMAPLSASNNSRGLENSESEISPLLNRPKIWWLKKCY